MAEREKEKCIENGVLFNLSHAYTIYFISPCVEYLEGTEYKEIKILPFPSSLETQIPLSGAAIEREPLLDWASSLPPPADHGGLQGRVDQHGLLGQLLLRNRPGTGETEYS